MALPTDESESGVSVWLRCWWRALTAEMLATALLVWLGVAAAVNAGQTGAPLAHPAMAFGFVVIANAVAFGPVSGAHMNPAVSLAALVTGHLPALAALGYMLAQLLGAVLGYAALMSTLPASWQHGCTQPAKTLSGPAAAAVEAALTGLLALACCGVWAAPPDPAAPIKLGLVVAGLVYAGGAATGASINPARSFAPALLHQHWDFQWVYWVGPLAGALLAALLHRALTPTVRPSAPATELLPFADKP